jgi:hypothetical protein
MGTFIAILQAIPAVKILADEFVSLYVQLRLSFMKAEHRSGIRKAIEEQDQRDLENAINSPLAGKKSDIAGTTVRDSLPNVMRNKIGN